MPPMREIADYVNFGKIAISVLTTFMIGFLGWLGSTMNEHSVVMARVEESIKDINIGMAKLEKNIDDIIVLQRQDETNSAAMKQKMEDIDHDNKAARGKNP